MEDLNRYFSDAEENISNEYMSANGEYSDWDDAFDFGGSEEEYLNAVGSADATSSQPYIISLYNSSSADVDSVEIGGAYNNITTVSGNKANTEGIKYSMKNFNKLKSNVYNLGLSSANISKLMLAKKIKKQIKSLKIQIVTNMKDPDKRDYFVSNKKIEKKGFKAKISLDIGIKELINLFKVDNKKVINKNYTIVNSVLVSTPDRPEVKIDWRIYTKDPNNPLIRDLIIEGLSLARTQKEEFLSVLNSNDNDMNAAVLGVIEAIGAGSLKDMGSVMAKLREDYAGQLDFGKASEIVKKRLG